MKQVLKKIIFFSPSALLIACFFFGIDASAQGTQSGYQLLAPFPQSVMGKTTGITLVDYMKGLFVATIGLAIVLAVVELVIGGIEYVAAAVPSSKEDAKKRIGGAVGGLLLILLAWVLLEALNPKLLNVGLNLKDVTVSGGPPGGGGPPPPPPPPQWCCYGKITGQQLGNPYPNESDCKASCNGLAQSCKVCGGNIGAGNCQVSGPGPCSPSSLAPYFGGDMTKATTFSKICRVENPSATPLASTYDLCSGRGVGNGPSFSFGLFQINILANSIGGFQCRHKAFTSGSRNYSCTIASQTEYNNCKNAAMDIDTNLKKMVELSNNGTNLQPWRCTAWRLGLISNNTGCGNIKKLACAGN